MTNIIHIDFTKRENNSRETNRVISAEKLLPPTQNVHIELAEEHDAEPIKSISDINRISNYLIAKKRYRDNMLFIVGINFGLRVSDLRELRFLHLINPDLTFKESFQVLETKTKNTRKKKKNRLIAINSAVINAVKLYLQHNTCRLDDYMFRSESNRGGCKNIPLSRMSIDRILKGINKELEIGIRFSTHTLRKTFGYHQMLASNNDPRKLLLLQKIFGHSSVAQTLDYIGITGEEMIEAYMTLNLGGSSCNLLDSEILDDAEYPA